MSGFGCRDCIDGLFRDPFQVSGLNSSCQQCFCDKNGSKNNRCSHDGICNCKDGVVGDKCSDCLTGFFPFPDCNTGIFTF